MNREEHLELIWKKIHAIRTSWKNPAQLNALLIEWEANFGPKYHDLAKELIAAQTRKVWADLASSRGEHNAIDDLVRYLWEDWEEGEFTIAKNDTGTQIYCTKCPIADAYRSIKKEHYGLLFHCSEDPYIVEGFNSAIKFQRTKTCMNDDCCDHHYSLKE
ncbi:MAG: L-2-amino-thiazoline-4-carboxylic acid hydrolase [Candidatus Hodarchaeota archaeon]